MGSPTNELHRNPNESPQTTVILTHGFWIGKFEVTQGEYLSVMSTNPSSFPGDLSRPVSSVSWLDATNYCTRLTQRELAAGRIPTGSHYRLPICQVESKSIHKDRIPIPSDGKSCVGVHTTMMILTVARPGGFSLA
jgi:hypothetical protein